MRSVVTCVVGMGILFWSMDAVAETGTVSLQGTTDGSSVSGSAMLMDSPHGLEVAVEVMGVAPGKHAIHIHQYGACDDKGNAAGGHFNPDGAPHGFLPSDGLSMAHPGDMGNLDVGQNGNGLLTVHLSGVTLSGEKYSVGGRAIVLHDKVDDFGQPTGNAGGRIGCGVIAITGQ